MARALWHEDNQKSVLRTKELLHQPGYIRVNSLYSFISQGTERSVALGQVPYSAKGIMEVPFMEGNLQLPCTYGYSLAGIVVQEDHPLHGKSVQLMHPHQEVIEVPESALRAVPEDLDIKNSILAANMETAVNAVWNASPDKTEDVLLIGFGSVGALTAIAIQNMTGNRVVVSDTIDYRRDRATKLGLETWDGQESFPLIFHSTGRATGLQTAIDHLKDYGRVIELSWYGVKPVSLQLGGSFHYGNKRIISSQVSSIPPHMKGWDFQKRIDLVWHLLGDERCSLLLDREVPFEEVPLFFEELRTGGTEAIGVYIKYVDA